jgi:xylitol oxidase
MRTNWAGNVAYRAAAVHSPSTVDEVRALVARAPRIRALGTGHTFNEVADTTAELVSLAGLPPTVVVDPADRTATVSAGLRYGDVAARLHAAGFALPNLASLPHISIPGAIATGTHGSGVHNGNLGTAVTALRLVTGAGDLVTIARGHPDFAGAVVGLGALGIVVELTLAVEPTYDIRQYVYEALPWAALTTDLAGILAGGYSVSLFTAWTGRVIEQVWLKRRLDEPEPGPEWYGARPADGPRHPIGNLDPVSCTAQLGMPGPWHERLPHFRLEHTPSAGDELQSEFFVDRADAVAALAAIDRIRDRVAPVTQISEIRTVAADDQWLSPAYRRDSVAIHFTWVRDTEAVTPVVAEVEAALAPFAARPHWGKVFTLAPDVLSRRYERLPDFIDLALRMDPEGVFRNDFVDLLST